MSATNRFTYVGLGVVLGLGFLAGAFLTPRISWAPPLIRIGVVNWQQVILQYEDYQKELKSLESKRKEILRYIEKEHGKLNRNKTPGRSRKSTSDSEVGGLYQDALKQYKQRRQRTIKEYRQNVTRAIREEAIEQGYSLILSENEVLYAAEGYTDLTSSVIKRLNSEK